MSEGEKLAKAFKDLGLNPKFDTAEDLQNWLKNFAASPPTETPTTTVVQSSHTHQPRLSIFYGESATKGEADYEQWRYEVKSLVHEGSCKNEVIMQAIRRSVRGEASRILMRLGTGATPNTILEKFESVYGTVDTKEELMAKFYSAKQEDSEDITHWSCRLEDILGKVVEQGLISTHGSEEMLRSKFWAGMRQDLKDISGFKFETVKDFDKLRVEMRKIEKEHKMPSKDAKKTTNMTCVAETKSNVQQNSEISELKHLVQDMAIRMNDMGKKLSDLKDQQSSITDARSNPTYNLTRGRPRFRSVYNPTSSFNNRRGGSHPVNSGPRCYRCRQVGHYQWQCNVRLDHLNGRPPCTRGRYRVQSSDAHYRS